LYRCVVKRRLTSRLIEISLWLPRLMVIKSRTFNPPPSDLWAAADYIHHQSSLDFLEFTKFRRNFMNRFDSYVVKLSHLPFASPICQRSLKCQPETLAPSSKLESSILPNQQRRSLYTKPNPCQQGGNRRFRLLADEVTGCKNVWILCNPRRGYGTTGSLMLW